MTISRKVRFSVLLLAALATGGQTQAATVDVTDVDLGEFDKLLVVTQLPNSGDQTELDWISSVVGDTVTLLDKTDYVESTIDQTILEVIGDLNPDGSDITDSYAMSIDDTTDYFLIKARRDSYLFENLGSLDYAYFTLGGISITEITTVSHLTTAISAIPLPAASWLFGTAILGLVGVAIRQAKTS